MSLTQLKDYVSYNGPGDWRTFKRKQREGHLYRPPREGRYFAMYDVADRIINSKCDLLLKASRINFTMCMLFAGLFG